MDYRIITNKWPCSNNEYGERPHIFGDVIEQILGCKDLFQLSVPFPYSSNLLSMMCAY